MPRFHKRAVLLALCYALLWLPWVGTRKPITSQKAPVILFWTTMWGNSVADRNLTCDGMRTCWVTSNKTFLEQASAVVFVSNDYRKARPPLPSTRDSAQIWVLFSLESPLNDPLKASPPPGMFNWSMTFHRAADVVVRTGDWKRVVVGKKPDYLPLISWIGTNCRDVWNNRTEYIRELMSHIQIDSWGKCLNNRRWRVVGTQRH